MSDEQEDQEVEPGEDGRFDAEYVSTLRGEAAARRVAAREAEERAEAAEARAEALRGRLLALEVGEAARGVLADPSDLLAHAEESELTGDDGNPDPERIAAAARALVERKAHLAPRAAPTGDVDQGARAPAPAGFDLAEALRSAAR